MMRDGALLTTGVAGTIVTALCCFTPMLAIGLGALGLATWIGWLDYILFPALAMFLGLTVYAWWRLRHRSTSGPHCDAGIRGRLHRS